jgi:serine/threonine-protein kinase SRPK3
LNESVSDSEWYGKYKPKLDLAILDRSFTNLGYIGYGEGIELEELDTRANW